MEVTPRNPLRMISIPCYLNRASLGRTENVFVIIRDLADQKGKVAWVPRTAVLVEQQQLRGNELKAKLTLAVKKESSDTVEALLLNRGTEETIRIPKGNGLHNHS